MPVMFGLQRDFNFLTIDCEYLTGQLGNGKCSQHDEPLQTLIGSKFVYKSRLDFWLGAAFIFSILRCPHRWRNLMNPRLRGMLIAERNLASRTALSLQNSVEQVTETFQFESCLSYRQMRTSTLNLRPRNIMHLQAVCAVAQQ